MASFQGGNQLETVLMLDRISELEGYLDHTKSPSSRTLHVQQAYPYGGPRGWAFPYERGTPVKAVRARALVRPVKGVSRARAEGTECRGCSMKRSAAALFVVYFIRANLRGASLGARLSGVEHTPILVLVMARVRQNGESFLIDSVIDN